MDEAYAILSGNPIKGWKLDGPFLSEDEALEWAKDAFDHPYWWTLPIAEPEFDIIEACGKCGSCLECDCDTLADDLDIAIPTPPVPDYVLNGV